MFRLAATIVNGLLYAPMALVLPWAGAGACYRFGAFFAPFFFAVGLAPGRGIVSLGRTASRLRSASRSFSGMWMVSPGFGMGQVLHEHGRNAQTPKHCGK
jgi:hypothetical protein